MDFCQTAILILSCVAIWLLAKKRDSVSRWGYVVGLASEPFWLYASYKAEQWGVFLVCLWWAWCYLKGIWNHWGTA